MSGVQTDPRRRSLRQAAIVMCITAPGWLFANWAMVRFGVTTRWAVLVDLFALAAFGWALIVIFLAWRTSPGPEGKGG